ncbi:IS110 family transposase [Bacillus sp. ZJS3]|uniref:IS110 family transposase n=1 Tax=Bacillus sp. ZJS3 TaxID=2928154 RepID=UPI0022282DBF|nr:IS110 family transposase [Bacillus sp. ZJS3]
MGKDVAKCTHYTCMVDERGLLLQKSFPFSHSRQEFEMFYKQIFEGMKQFGKTDFIIGIEPTAHYRLNLAYFLDDRGIPLVICNSMLVI